MPALTIGYGAVLIVLGLISYFGTGTASKTALIPSWFGIVALLLGLIALKAGARKHAMHVASVLGLLGFVAPLGRIFKGINAGTFDISKPATMAQVAMSILSLAFLAMCVRSFIAARRARRALEEPQA